LHSESIARCKHHMQEKLVYCCTYLENLWFYNKNVKNIFLSMCDVKWILTFASLGLVLFWQLFYLFCSSIVINTDIVTAGTFKP
jgi:hypothetical protein